MKTGLGHLYGLPMLAAMNESNAWTVKAYTNCRVLNALEVIEGFIFPHLVEARDINASNPELKDRSVILEQTLLTFLSKSGRRNESGLDDSRLEDLRVSRSSSRNYKKSKHRVPRARLRHASLYSGSLHPRASVCHYNLSFSNFLRRV